MRYFIYLAHCRSTFEWAFSRQHCMQEWVPWFSQTAVFSKIKNELCPKFNSELFSFDSSVVARQSSHHLQQLSRYICQVPGKDFMAFHADFFPSKNERKYLLLPLTFPSLSSEHETCCDPPSANNEGKQSDVKAGTNGSTLPVVSAIHVCVHACVRVCAWASEVRFILCTCLRSSDHPAAGGQAARLCLC